MSTLCWLPWLWRTIRCNMSCFLTNKTSSSLCLFFFCTENSYLDVLVGLVYLHVHSCELAETLLLSQSAHRQFLASVLLSKVLTLYYNLPVTVLLQRSNQCLRKPTNRTANSLNDSSESWLEFLNFFLYASAVSSYLDKISSFNFVVISTLLVNLDNFLI